MTTKLNQPPDGAREEAVAWARLKRESDQLRRETKGVPPSAQTQRLLDLFDLCAKLHANWLAGQRQEQT